MIRIAPLATIAPDAVETLLDRAFGPERHKRTAYKIRGARQAIPALSFVAIDGEMLVGSIQCWPVMLSADDGTVLPLVMVGPVAVTPERQREGIGRMLVGHALGEAGAEPMMLIGDPEYYGRLFGFSAARTSAWRLPGPVEPRRVLARGDIPDIAGTLGPAVPVAA